MAAIPSSTNTASSSTHPVGNQTGPFAIMTTLFFLWGFMTVFNDILIPRFKEAFDLTFFQAMLVQFAFFGAYFVGSVLYFIISAVSGDPIAKIGYKNGVVIGLLISATGSALFWPAAAVNSYPLFLFALFVVGLGFTMLQIAANPYVTILGPERTAASRLNLAQGFNSFGTTIGPIIGGFLIFQYFVKPDAHGADSVKVPYLIFSIVFAVMALIFFFIKLPEVGAGKVERGMGALKFPHVVLGIIAIFMYVGGEVAIGSSIINFLEHPDIAGMKVEEASIYVSLFWGGLLIGRFMAAVELSELKSSTKQILMAAIPLAAVVVLGLIRGKDTMLHYLPFVVLCWVLFRVGKGLAARTLVVFCSTIVVLLLVSILVGGKVAMWCVISIGLFSSIGWSNTFSLALEGTGALKSQVSSLLVMAILGGALLPPVQGYVADATQNLPLSFIVPLIAFAYVAFYGLKGHKIGKKA